MAKKVLGSLYTESSKNFQDGIYPISRCIKAEKHDLGVIEIEGKQIENRNIDEKNQKKLKIIVAMRGRNPDNPSDRATGIPTEQRLEPNSQGICNTLTTVSKDNIVLEKEEISIEELQEYQAAKIDEIYSVTDREKDQNGKYRIRKLTPLETWRLMSFLDEDFHKAEKVNSNSQLYKQAGNSLVRVVMMAIFSQLNIKNVKQWNHMSKEERNEVIEGNPKP